MTSRPFGLNRLLAAVAALATAVPLMTACSSDSFGSTSAGAAGTVENSSIVLQTINGLQPTFKKFADAYMQAYPNRKVEVRATTDDPAAYTQQLATARISGQMPDVFFNVDFLSNTLWHDHVTLDLAPGIAQGKLGGLKESDFLPQFLGQYRPATDQGKLTGIPVSADSFALFYNKDVFTKAGVTEFPSSSWTWDDVYRVATQISKKGGGKYTGLIAPLGTGSNVGVFGPVLKAEGSKFYDAKSNTIDLSSPAAIEGWKLLLKAYGDAAGPYVAANGSNQTLAFKSGNVAMDIKTSADVPALRTALSGGNWDVIPLPKINGNSTTGGGSYGLSISQSSKNQDAAWAFLAWFYASDKGMKVAESVANAIPPTKDGIDHGSWRDVKPPANISAFADSARSAVLLPSLPGTSGTVLTAATVKATQEVLLKGKDVTAAFKEAEDSVNAQLKKDGASK